MCLKWRSLPTVNGTSSVQTSFERRNKSSSALDLRPRLTKLEPLVGLQKKKNSLDKIKVGSLDEKIKTILESVEEKTKQPTSPLADFCKEIKAIPRHSKERETSAKFLEANKKSEGDTQFLKYLDEFKNKYEEVNDFEKEKEPKINLTPFEGQIVEKPESVRSESIKMKDQTKNGFFDKQIAKRFHDENLRHKPLPDIIDDPVFKAIVSRREPNPGASLQVQPGPTAIGWKSYTAPGPTECSKLKVYRPKTAVDKIKPPKEGRPKTSGNKDYHGKNRYLPIDLAICWDLKPDDSSLETKRSPHIDGSNGSAAPAVFSMIRPNEALDEESIPGSCQAVAERISTDIENENAANLPSQTNGNINSPIGGPVNKEAILACIKSPPKPKTNTPESINSISTNAADYARQNPKTAWSNEDTSQVLSKKLMNLQREKAQRRARSSVKNDNQQWVSSESNHKKHHQSTPNLAMACEGSHCGTEKNSSASSLCNSVKKQMCNSGSDHGQIVKTNDEKEKSKLCKNHQKTRNCVACEKSNLGCDDNSREKSEYKPAFKAGVPNSESSSSGSTSIAKSYKAPKMRLPFAKKSYSIGTLIPPFSLWPENNGQEYPEHWRLASVYQHSYKPLNARKRPLLATVYQ